MKYQIPYRLYYLSFFIRTRLAIRSTTSSPSFFTLSSRTYRQPTQLSPRLILTLYELNMFDLKLTYTLCQIPFKVTTFQPRSKFLGGRALKNQTQTLPQFDQILDLLRSLYLSGCSYCLSLSAASLFGFKRLLREGLTGWSAQGSSRFLSFSRLCHVFCLMFLRNLWANCKEQTEQLSCIQVQLTLTIQSLISRTRGWQPSLTQLLQMIYCTVILSEGLLVSMRPSSCLNPPQSYYYYSLSGNLSGMLIMLSYIDQELSPT